eukprot:TRINITY_DN1169_c0_g2_i3.p1 TRINITY_DN1169_c0_g2~~TRINITY_DN1169_c0_g2_i3.p1  ORF type:complete len:229 (+),score=52.18 TRINITY_DN1169_c0_g2_i3:82-768(+)
MLVVALFFAVCSATSWQELEHYTFEDYEKEFSKFYTKEERQGRELIFTVRLAEILKHNQDVSKSWKLGVNPLTDRTEEEFNALLGSHTNRKASPHHGPHHVYPDKLEDLTVDWRDQHIITAVKDQGQCGSCWSFATAEVTESYYALKTGQLPVLSEQQILDCTPNPNNCGGTGGCGGGTAELAFAKIQELGGLATEWTYPYESYFGNPQVCTGQLGFARAWEFHSQSS